MLAVLPKNHPLAEQKSIQLTDLEDEPYILLEEGHYSEPSLRFNSSQQGVTKSFITRHISASRQIDCLLISEGATASNTFRQA